LRWGPNDWKLGYDARGPAPISSFDVLDAILTRLADPQIFPELRTVVIAGHSAGGQFVQRYAAVGHGQAPLLQRGVHLRYVVANPSSYVYFTTDRPIEADQRAEGSTPVCPEVNRWEYGLEGSLPSYVSRPVNPQALERDYLARDVVYLLGTADNDPAHHQLDRSCAAEPQGATRFDRGLRYFANLSSGPHGELTQRLLAVPGIGHHSLQMLSSVCGRAALFDQGGCTPASTSTPAAQR
jgi:pimeloyl-ACP methyl ester carboxylesterase